MAALVIVIVALGVSAATLLRWASEDYARFGRLTNGAAIAAWLVGVTHAALVSIAAGAALLEVPLYAPAAVTAGVIVGGAGAILLGRGLSALGSLDAILGRTNGALVTTGAYAISRNPQALGWGLLLTGGTIAGRSFAALLLVIPYWALLAAYCRSKNATCSRSMASATGLTRDGCRGCSAGEAHARRHGASYPAETSTVMRSLAAGLSGAWSLPTSCTASECRPGVSPAHV